MANPTTRELEQCLARWAGVEIEETTGVDPYGGNLPYPKKWLISKEFPKVWHPLTDANQMELVEEGLKKHKPQRLTWTIKFINTAVSAPRYGVMLESFHDEIYEHKNWYHEHVDKKRALALAIQEMEQCDNIQKTAPPVS